MAKTVARPDRDGTHRLAFERNKKKIYATQTVCGICGKPVDFSYKFPHPLSPTIAVIPFSGNTMFTSFRTSRLPS